jgi:hypothetical protein
LIEVSTLSNECSAEFDIPPLKRGEASTLPITDSRLSGSGVTPIIRLTRLVKIEASCDCIVPCHEAEPVISTMVAVIVACKMVQVTSVWLDKNQDGAIP